MYTESKSKGIYKITCLKNNMSYIGYTMDNFKNRCRWHRNGKKHRNIAPDWDKYGKKNFIFEIIEEIQSNDKKIFQDREIYWINKLNTIWPHGYNMSNGILPLEETLKKLSNKLSGKNNPMYGRKNKVNRTITNEQCLQIKKMLLENTNEKWMDKYERIRQELNLKTNKIIKDIKSGSHWSCKEILDGGYKDWIDTNVK